MTGGAVVTAGVAGPGNPAASKGAAEQDAQRQRLVCRAGNQLWAVPLDRVIEVMRALPIKPIPGGPRYVRGLCIIRGAPVPVVDTGLLVGMGATDCARLVAVRTGSTTVALAADAVLGIWTIGAHQLGGLPPLLGDGASDTIAAIGSLDAELLYVLQTTRIVPDDLFDRLVNAGELS